VLKVYSVPSIDKSSTPSQCANLHGFSLHAAVRASRDGATHIVMSALKFMQRLAELVPRPRHHLIRFDP
jgi:Putative transposase